jgi:predicted NBD/HSP70 family sugar kinase
MRFSQDTIFSWNIGGVAGGGVITDTRVTSGELFCTGEMIGTMASPW